MEMEALVDLHILYMLFGFSVLLVRIMNPVLHGLTMSLVKWKM